MSPSPSDRDRDDQARDDESEASQTQETDGQVSEAGGSLDAGEENLGGADAVPDKTTGSGGSAAS